MINDLKWFRSADLILYAVLIVLTLQVYRLMAFEDRGEAVAVVEYDGEILGRYSLQVDQQLTLDAFEAAIFLTIEDGAVWVSKVDCPAQLCKRVGKIYRQGQSIACVPNKLLIYIERKAGEQGPPQIIIG